jgi:lipoteichoic acid synthase
VTPPTEAETPPNVVIVVMESVGYWATSLADAKRETTPTLVRLAAEGVDFPTTRVIFTGTTKSIFAILTGITPSLESEIAEGVLVDPPYESIGAILARRGYRSAYFQMAVAESAHAPMFANLGFDVFWSQEDCPDPSRHLSYVAGDDFAMLEPAFDWARSQQGPWLLVLMTSVAHDPYVVPDWFGPPEKTEVDRYLQCVRYTDAFVEAVQREVQRLEPRGNTLLSVTADHGEGFPFQHKLWGHLEIPFDEVLRVPWVLWWPGRLSPEKVTTPMSIMDQTPTILSLLGYGIDEAGFEGVNALGNPDPLRRHYFACRGSNSPRGYVEGDIKYVYNPRARTVVRYDLKADPLERSPRFIDGEAAERVVQDLLEWQRARRIHFPPERFVRRVVFDNWIAWSSGRKAWSYYRPGRAEDLRP